MTGFHGYEVKAAPYSREDTSESDVNLSSGVLIIRSAFKFLEQADLQTGLDFVTPQMEITASGPLARLL